MNVPNIGTTNVDSIVRSSSKRGRESFTDQVGRGVGVPAVGRGREGTSVIPPAIIGRAPLPHFPDALRSTRPEGEVVVRFKVDEFGAIDVGTMTVVRSDDPLFTAAVRNILPQFHFEPARTAPPESKPVAVWVSLPFQFTAKK